MSSVAKRIIIEEYENGGFGVIGVKGTDFEEMGLTNELDVIDSITRFLRYSEREGVISTKKGCGKKWFKKGIGLYYICPDVAGLCPECQKSTKEEEKE